MDFYGLVLAGGGGKGAYQIGAMKAMEQCGFTSRIQAVSGASIGALNAVFFAGGDLERAEQTWKNLKPLRQTGDPEQTVTMEDLAALIGRMEEAAGSPENTSWTIEVYANACPAGTNECHYFCLNEKSSAERRAILLASSAFPGVCPPVEINGQSFIDGGVADNLPVRPLYEKGYRKLIVVLLSDHAEIPQEEFPDAEFLVIRPSESIGDFFDGTLDFSPEGVRRRMELGFADALRVLKKVRREEE